MKLNTRYANDMQEEKDEDPNYDYQYDKFGKVISKKKKENKKSKDNFNNPYIKILPSKLKPEQVINKLNPNLQTKTSLVTDKLNNPPAFYTPTNKIGVSNDNKIKNNPATPKNTVNGSSAGGSQKMTEADKLVLDNILSYNKPTGNLKQQQDVATKRAANTNRLNEINKQTEQQNKKGNLLTNTIIDTSKSMGRMVKGAGFNPAESLGNVGKGYVNNIKGSANLVVGAFNNQTGGNLKKLNTGENKSIIERTADNLKKGEDYRKEIQNARKSGQQGFGKSLLQSAAGALETTLNISDDAFMSGLGTVATQKQKDLAKKGIEKLMSTKPGQKISDLANTYETNMEFLKKNDPTKYRDFKTAFTGVRGGIEGAGFMGISKVAKAGAKAGLKVGPEFAQNTGKWGQIDNGLRTNANPTDKFSDKWGHIGDGLKTGNPTGNKSPNPFFTKNQPEKISTPAGTDDLLASLNGVPKNKPKSWLEDNGYNSLNPNKKGSDTPLQTLKNDSPAKNVDGTDVNPKAQNKKVNDDAKVFEEEILDTNQEKPLNWAKDHVKEKLSTNKLKEKNADIDLTDIDDTGRQQNTWNYEQKSTDINSNNRKATGETEEIYTPKDKIPENTTPENEIPENAIPKDDTTDQITSYGGEGQLADYKRDWYQQLFSEGKFVEEPNYLVKYDGKGNIIPESIPKTYFTAGGRTHFLPSGPLREAVSLAELKAKNALDNFKNKTTTKEEVATIPGNVLGQEGDIKINLSKNEYKKITSGYHDKHKNFEPDNFAITLNDPTDILVDPTTKAITLVKDTPHGTQYVCPLELDPKTGEYNIKSFYESFQKEKNRNKGLESVGDRKQIEGQSVLDESNGTKGKGKTVVNDKEGMLNRKNGDEPDEYMGYTNEQGVYTSPRHEYGVEERVEPKRGSPFTTYQPLRELSEKEKGYVNNLNKIKSGKENVAHIGDLDGGIYSDGKKLKVIIKAKDLDHIYERHGGKIQEVPFENIVATIADGEYTFRNSSNNNINIVKKVGEDNYILFSCTPKKDDCVGVTGYEMYSEEGIVKLLNKNKVSLVVKRK